MAVCANKFRADTLCSHKIEKDILTAVVDIENFVVVRSIEVIGEATKNLPEQLKAQYSEVPWKRMTGMRDKLVHGYFGIDYKTLYKAAVEDIPPIKPLIERIIVEQKKA